MPFSLLCFTQILCSICSLTCALRKTEVNYLSPLLYPHPAHMTVHQARNSGIHISPTILPSSASGHYRLQNLDSLGCKGHRGPPSRSPTLAGRPLATAPAGEYLASDCPAVVTGTRHLSRSASPYREHLPLS